MATNIAAEVQLHATHLILLDSGQVKVDSTLLEVSQRFVKLRRQKHETPEFTSLPNCLPVGVNLDRSISYLVPKETLASLNLSPANIDQRGITIEEIFIYYTHSSTLNDELRRVE